VAVCERERKTRLLRACARAHARDKVCECSRKFELASEKKHVCFCVRLQELKLQARGHAKHVGKVAGYIWRRSQVDDAVEVKSVKVFGHKRVKIRVDGELHLGQQARLETVGCKTQTVRIDGPLDNVHARAARGGFLGCVDLGLEARQERVPLLSARKKATLPWQRWRGQSSCRSIQV
jgi:hypothetical protein